MLIFFLIGLVFFLLLNTSKGGVTVENYEKILEIESRQLMKNELLYLEFLHYMKNKKAGDKKPPSFSIDE